MLKKIESLINRSPFYNLVRFNPLSDLLIEIKTKRTRKAIAFFSSFLDNTVENKLVYDIGANKGTKVKAMLKMGFKVIAIEPEKKALSTLKWRFGRNKKVAIIDKALSDKESTLVIHIAEGRSGLNTLSDKWVDSLEMEKTNRWHKKHVFKKSYEVPVSTLEHVFSEYGVPYYVKIDVEGYEVNVIKGMKQLPAYLSFETNLPEFLDETTECIRLLNSLSDKIVYNYSISDKLESKKWLSKEDILGIINDPSLRYMEIIARKGDG